MIAGCHLADLIWVFLSPPESNLLLKILHNSSNKEKGMLIPRERVTHQSEKVTLNPFMNLYWGPVLLTNCLKMLQENCGQR